ncbi:MAG TPA: class I SAM-dependent methyltransferase [Roseiflexaceae bacterium]|nr:class I SAM-dependent methyltransferase [Roseiflexaceae bacterium]
MAEQLAISNAEDATKAEQLAVPDAAIRYILFQRTAYLRFPITPLYRWLQRFLPARFPLPIYNLVVAVESRLGRARTKALYQADMQREYTTLRWALPPRCGTVLDIGCGVAGIDALIQRHYAGQPIDFVLLDKTAVDRSVYYLFNPRASFYNSLDVAADLLAQNGIPRERIHLLEADERGTLALDRPVDLVISLLSWGFHYPVATYLARVRELLRPGGVLILDLRRNTDGLDQLRQSFARIDVLEETPKYLRVRASDA